MKNYFSFWVLVVVCCSCSLTPSHLTQTLSQYTQDTAAIHSYLKQNNIRATIINQGIWFIIDSAATGIRPVFNDTIKITYTTRLLANGNVIEQASTPVVAPASSFVVGARYAFPQFQAGSKGRIFIPGYYVNNGIGTKTMANPAPIILSFNLWSVKDNQLLADTATIGTYLRNNSISTLKDVSGIRYTFNTLGAGPIPSLTSNVTVDYTAKVLSTGAIVDQRNGINLTVSDLIPGWQIMLVKMNEGSACTLYVPSSLGYGPYQQGTIPANANMVFTIKLSKVNSN
ncbi:MAG: FKBP-type peptidyl-prolyl cis-trans isomerase [Bacteroidetes bacterium]|nr:FKBP-type peptidyl-prolyl cis-trans isomerase [Bacteroidota bacterium]